MSEKILLSIGMIVKNEEKYLNRCLIGLLPLLQQVKSELIIVDTGSTDSTVEISKNFTDKVYTFKWCNDFSAARNETLRYAKGEWYMFIDGDEIFETKESIAPLIDFFNSGEYKKYGSASHQMNNIVDENDKTKCLIAYPLRLAKCRNDLHFTSTIHEYLNTFSPTKMLTACSNHYGYDFTDDLEKKRLKHERNLALLLNEYEKDKTDMRIIAHIVKQYEAGGDIENAEKYLDIMYNAVRYKPKADHAFFAYYRKALLFKDAEDFNAVIKICDEYFNMKQNECGTDIDMYYLRGHSHLSLEQTVAAIDDLEKSLELFDRLNKGTLDSDDLMTNESIISKYKFYEKTSETIAHAYGSLDNREKAFFWLEPARFNSVSSLALYLVLAQSLNCFEKIAPFYFELCDLQNKNFLNAFAAVFEDLVAKNYIPQSVFADFANSKHEKDDFATLQASRYIKPTEEEKEFAQYGIILKQKIGEMIESKQFDNAMEIITQLEKLLPNDCEIKRYKKMCTAPTENCAVTFNEVKTNEFENVDSLFNKLVKNIENVSLDKLLYGMKKRFKQLEPRFQKSLESYFEKYHFWGSLCSKKNDFEYIEKKAEALHDHLADFIWLYSRLTDNQSKAVLVATLRNWFYYDFEMLGKIKDTRFKDYFDLDLIPSAKDEVLVDLGAFIGDSVYDFISIYGENSYKKIYCYEITPVSFEAMKKNLAPFKNIVYKQKGASDKAGTMYISLGAEGSSNKLSDVGDTAVELVSMDEDITEPVTIIKMDIEGAEQSALLGCAKHIQSNHPKLLISVYHSNEDIWKIPRMIDEICSGYQFYLRYHGGNLCPTETTLLAFYKNGI